MTGAEPRTELGDLHESRLTVRERSGRKESADLKLFQSITTCPLVTLRDREEHRPSPLKPTWIAVDDVTCRLQDAMLCLGP